MFKTILEKSELKNELGPYEILDVGGGGRGGHNTTNFLLEYFDVKKHSITIHHWSKWNLDGGTEYCKTREGIKEIDADFYSYDYGDKKFDLIIIDMPSELNMKDWEQNLLKNKVFDLLKEGGSVITYIMTNTSYTTFKDLNVVDVAPVMLELGNVDISEAFEVIVRDKLYFQLDTYANGGERIHIGAEDMNKNVTIYNDVNNTLKNHMTSYWNVDVDTQLTECLDRVPYTSKQLNNESFHGLDTDYYKRRLDNWFYYCNLNMELDTIKKTLPKKMSNHYIVKNILNDQNRDYIVWVELEKSKEEFVHKITTTISTNNNLEYLKLAIKSVRQNCYYNDMPIIVHAENCDDGTDEWLEENKDKYDLEIYIDHNDNPKGIGGGMDFCVDKVKTEFVNIIHSDMWVAPNQDMELLKLYDDIDDDVRLIASSYRIQPRIFVNDPPSRPGCIFHEPKTFGVYCYEFDSDYFDEWAVKFSNDNNVHVRKAGGAGFFCRKRDYDYIGGNDPLFAPASWEDMDLFSRMQRENYQFIMTTKSVVWHFSARGSHFRDEAKDDFTKKSERQQVAERKNVEKWIKKWGRLPDYDDQTFVIPIDNPNVPNIIRKDE